MITSTSFQKVSPTSQVNIEQWNELQIPRRPPWTKEMSVDELEFQEKESFLAWRRSLGHLDDSNHIVTPYEKNLEVWRQLWRVVERSDIVVQIVDSRNPLLFRSLDLEQYVLSHPHKKNLLLINKSDLLTETQRSAWQRWLTENGVDFLFWSADFERVKQETLAQAARVAEQAAEEERAKRAAELMGRLGQEPSSDEDSEEAGSESEEAEESETEEIVMPEKNSTEVYNREQLLQYFRQYASDLGPLVDHEGEPRRVMVGFVGYPNVGKSSTINALAAAKTVRVSATPGKTKHFQTIIIDENICLCDCPGLVFPTIMSSRGEMVCNGILPIDELREWIEPTLVVCRRVPRLVLEEIYSMQLPLPQEHEDPGRAPSPQELLQTYAIMHGYMAQQGIPDEFRAARIILKDYVKGKLPHGQPPPGMLMIDYLPPVEAGTGLRTPMPTSRALNLDRVDNTDTAVEKMLGRQLGAQPAPPSGLQQKKKKRRGKPRYGKKGVSPYEEGGAASSSVRTTTPAQSGARPKVRHLLPSFAAELLFAKGFSRRVLCLSRR